jgi:cellulose synthase/poly-beta-1,6-N-acetylglucosamine synthase-like glycosyltransferase
MTERRSSEPGVDLKQGLPPMDHPTTLSIIVPAFNERATIAEILRRVLAVEIPLEKELIIVDDGSTDGTRELLRELEGRIQKTSAVRMKLVFQEKNQGKGAAIRAGVVRQNLICDETWRDSSSSQRENGA